MDVKQKMYQDDYNKDDYESSFEDSTGSSFSPSSSDLNLTEDETSSSSLSSYGPLYELSELMEQLPIKRGLSKYYQGKSQTFTSLSSVKSLEDLAKRKRTNRRKMKACKSYGGLDDRVFSPKAIISKKKNYRVSLLSTSEIGRVGTVFSSFGSLRS